MSENHLVRPLSRDDVLTEQEAADALQISLEKFRKAGFPTTYFGRDGRVIWGKVLDMIAERAA